MGTWDPVYDPDQDACVVCLDEAKSHILVPCGHQCVCGPCSELLAQGHCPVCRNAVDCLIKFQKSSLLVFLILCCCRCCSTSTIIIISRGWNFVDRNSNSMIAL